MADDFQTIKARIADEMKRADLTACATSVQNSVLDAVKYWETKRFWFNTARDTSKLTTTGSAFLSSVPSSILKIDSLKLTVNATDYALKPVPYSLIDSIDTANFTSYPEVYSFYNVGTATATSVIRFYPVPQGAYTATVSYLRRLPALASADSTNQWVVEAEPMIRAYAKGLLFEHQLRAPDRAQRMYDMAVQEYRSLRKVNQYQRATGFVTKTPW